MMDAGRELDAMIHEKVMDLFGAYRYEGAFGHEQKRFVNDDLPHYSTDIAAAWLVVEKMSETHNIDINRLDDLFVKEIEWRVTLQPFGKYDFVMEIAPTAPHAICLAALKAVGVET